jgi:hypothetical protein
MPLVIIGDMVVAIIVVAIIVVVAVIMVVAAITGLRQVMQFTHIRFIRVRLATCGIRTCIRTVSCLPERGGRAVTLENVS